MTRSAYIALVGRPNVGKSTLLNALCGEKQVAVSRVPQTTRLPARGVKTVGDVQLVFVDLPGYAKARTLLGERLNKTVRSEVGGADMIVLMLDAHSGVGSGDKYIFEKICNWGVPIICAVNKIDRAGKARTAVALDECSKISETFAEYVPISAETGDGLDVLIECLAAHAPAGPFLYSPDDVFPGSAAGIKGQIAEIIRARLIEAARDELPYSIAVVVDEIRQRPASSAGETRPDGLVEIAARVVVERESQKGLVIGKGGESLKRAGTHARADIEKLLGQRVYLDLRAVVMKNWQRDPKALERLGF